MKNPDDPEGFSSARNPGGLDPSDAAIRNEGQRINLPVNWRAWDGVTDDPETKDLMAWFHTHCLDRNLSRSAIGKLIGFDRTSAGRILAGTYPAQDWSHIFARVAEYRAQNTRPTAIGGISIEPEWVDTAPGRMFRQALAHAGRGGFSIIVGSAGVGKTKTCDHWDQSNPGRMVRVRAPFNGSANALVSSIAKALGMSYRKRTATDIQLMLAEKFTGRQVLLVDQGSRVIPSINQCKAYALELLMDLYEDGLGIVLPVTLRDLEMLADFRYQIEQVTRRAEIFAAPEIEVEDVAAIASQFGRFSPAVVTALHDLATRPGALGTVTHVLNIGTWIAQKSKVEMTDEHVMRGIENRFKRLPGGKDPFDRSK